jgi:L-malate glycosyltransferase
MHVLILPSWYFPAGSAEIAGRMFHHHALALREEGIDARVMYIQRDRKSPLFKKTTWHEEEKVPTYRASHWFPPKANTLLVKIWTKQCAKDIRKYISKHGAPDIIHAQSYMAGSVCAELQKKINIPFVYTERLSQFVLHGIPKFQIPFIQKAFSSASAITCVSPGLMHALEAHSPKSVRVIPNFFNDTIFYPDPKVEKNHAFTFVSIGEPAQIKGLDLLLHAFASLQEKFHEKELQLVLIDRISEEEELKKLAQSLGIERNITWTGLITQVEIAGILRQSHVLVSASRVETFGKAILEAQACGLPVVATKTDGAEYILTSSSQGELVALNDANALMRGMAKVMAGYDQYQPGTIQKNAEKRFGKKVVMQQWINLYKSLQA